MVNISCFVSADEASVAEHLGKLIPAGEMKDIIINGGFKYASLDMKKGFDTKALIEHFL